MEREEVGSYHAGKESEAFSTADGIDAVAVLWNGARVVEMLLRCDDDRRGLKGAEVAGNSMAPSRHAQKMQSDDAEAVWSLLAMHRQYS